MSPAEIRKLLRHDVERLKAASKFAFDRFDAIVGDIPNSLPYADGVQRIRNASVEVAASRTRLMHAIRRETTAFLVHGTIPDDLAELCLAQPLFQFIGSLGKVHSGIGSLNSL